MRSIVLTLPLAGVHRTEFLSFIPARETPAIMCFAVDRARYKNNSFEYFYSALLD